MKKNTILISALFFTATLAYAQEGRVGINTSTPAATLDVVASPSDGTRIDGFIAPRLKGSELKVKDDLYTTAQEGAIVYVTEAVSGVTDKTTNVTSIGYYYFDKTQGTAGRWMKIGNGGTIPNGIDLTNDEWINNGTAVILGAKADGTPRDSGTDIVATNNGRIGIGTSAPETRLDIPNGVARVGLPTGYQTRVGSGYVDFFDNTGAIKGNIALNNADGYLVLNSFGNSGDTAFNTLTGKVGIGIAYPTEQLDIAREGVRIRQINSTTYTGSATDKMVVADADGVLKTVDRPVVAPVGDLTKDEWVNATGKVHLAKLSNGTTNRGDGEDVTILDNGRVGIGTANPQDKFHLDGGVARFTNSGGENRYTRLGAGFIDFHDAAGILRGNIAYNNTYNSLAINAVNDAFTVLNPTSGRVIIGRWVSYYSSNPNIKLEVDGTIQTVGNYYPDYVFENYFKGSSNLNANYKFKSIYDTEKFIQENRHLPGVTPIKDLVKTENGYSFNITELSTQTLEKVEELYLHTIEQQKQIDELKELVKTQQEQINQLLKK